MVIIDEECDLKMKGVKLLLIEPPKKEWPLLADTALPPVGLACLAAYLRKEGINVEVLDTMYPQIGMDEIRDFIRQKNPDIVGIASETYCANAANEVVRITKSLNPKTITIGGGSYLTLNWNEVLKSQPDWDFIVIGEGEITLTELYNAIASGKDPGSIPGIAYRKNGEVVRTPERPPIPDLDSLPMPAWDLFQDKMKHYKLILLGDNDVAITTTSRGCPYDCTFCSERLLWGRTWRARSAKKIVDEMELLKSYGKKAIWFGDDTFNIDRQRVIELCQEIEKRNLNMKWSMEARSDLIYRDLDLIPRMKKCGLFWVMVGVEFSDDTELKYYGKDISIRETREAFNTLKSNDIISQAMFIIGTIDETRESVDKKYNLARDLDADFTIFTPMTPFPGTKVYQEAHDLGLIVDTNLDHYNFLNVVMRGKYLSAEEIDHLINVCYRRYYGRPWRNLKYLFSHNIYRRNLIWHFIKYSYKSFNKKFRETKKRAKEALKAKLNLK